MTTFSFLSLLSNPSTTTIETKPQYTNDEFLPEDDLFPQQQTISAQEDDIESLLNSNIWGCENSQQQESIQEEIPISPLFDIPSFFPKILNYYGNVVIVNNEQEMEYIYAQNRFPSFRIATKSCISRRNVVKIMKRVEMRRKIQSQSSINLQDLVPILSNVPLSHASTPSLVSNIKKKRGRPKKSNPKIKV